MSCYQNPDQYLFLWLILGTFSFFRNFVSDIHSKTGQILSRGVGTAQQIGSGADMEGTMRVNFQMKVSAKPIRCRHNVRWQQHFIPDKRYVVLAIVIFFLKSYHSKSYLGKVLPLCKLGGCLHLSLKLSLVFSSIYSPNQQTSLSSGTSDFSPKSARLG